MASILKVDDLRGNTTANDITVTVGTSATMNLLIGIVKMYAQSNNITPAVADSLNTASLTDNATGSFTYNFTTNMSNATYGYGECSGEESGASGNSSTRTVSHSHRTSSTFRTSNRNSSNTLTDAGAACISTYGELA
tara:strand:+ start:641 stop:1051 length:411 start_codon:yes stop_codon:yes gene_type:complete